MSLYVEDYIARSLKKMRDQGQLDNDKYKGKPLELAAYFRSDKNTRAINRYLADAGFVPPKVALLKEIKILEQQYQHEPSDELNRKLNALRLKYNVEN